MIYFDNYRNCNDFFKGACLKRLLSSSTPSLMSPDLLELSLFIAACLKRGARTKTVHERVWTCLNMRQRVLKKGDYLWRWKNLSIHFGDSTDVKHNPILSFFSQFSKKSFQKSLKYWTHSHISNYADPGSLTKSSCLAPA